MDTQNIEEHFNQILSAIAEGKNPRNITQDLVQQGFEPDNASSLVKQAVQIKKAAMRKAGLRLFFTGVACIFVGIAITAVTYGLAARGGTYVITIGAFVVGAIYILRGLWFMLLG